MTVLSITPSNKIVFGQYRNNATSNGEYLFCNEKSVPAWGKSTSEHFFSGRCDLDHRGGVMIACCGCIYKIL